MVILPELDSLRVREFWTGEDGLKDYEDSFSLAYRSSCKTSFSINLFNLMAYDRDVFIAAIPLAKILDNMGATYFTRGGEDDDGNHKDYKVTFNDNNLPVRVDGLVTRRIWTATYQ